MLAGQVLAYHLLDLTTLSLVIGFFRCFFDLLCTFLTRHQALHDELQQVLVTPALLEPTHPPYLVGVDESHGAAPESGATWQGTEMSDGSASDAPRCRGSTQDSMWSITISSKSRTGQHSTLCSACMLLICSDA